IAAVKSIPETEKIAYLIDRDTATSYPVSGPSGGDSLVLEFSYQEYLTIQSMRIDQLPVSLYSEVEFQSADRNDRFITARKFTIDRRNINFEIGPKRFEPLSFSVPPTTSNKFRLVFQNINASHGAGFREISLLSTPVVDQYIDKQLGTMASDPIPAWDAYLWPDQAEPLPPSVVAPAGVVDLTPRVDTS